MIRLRPDTDPWRALELLVAHPGALDVEALGERLWRPAISKPGDVLAARAALRANQAAQASADVAAVWSRRASVVVARLVELGLVAPTEPVRLCDEWAGITWSSDIDEDGEPSAELLEEIADAIAAELGHERRQPSEHGPRLVAALLQGPMSTTTWLGERPTGARKRAAARLIAGRIVLRPGLRWPTPEGVARIAAGPPRAAGSSPPARAVGSAV